MKRLFINITALIAIAAGFASCAETMGDTDGRLSDVKNLIEPLSGKQVVLEPAPSASVYFEWEYVKAEDSGVPVYSIAFDRQGGDFSSPVYVTLAANNGLSNNVTLTHKQINKIAGMAGIAASETGTLKWTVFSSKGTKSLKSAQENTIDITRLAGFSDVPIDVYLTGDASEGGSNIAKSHKMKAVAGGEFEVYTKLAGGKEYFFTDGISGTPRVFYTSDGLIKENGASTVPADGIYRITLDFNTGACTYATVTRIGFYFSPAGAILFDLPYAGYGVFQAKATVTFQQESWGRDQRYKFRMFMKDNAAAAERELEWTTLNQTDSPPTATSPESYYYLQLLESLSQWDNKWKLMSDFDGVEAVYTIYLTADQPYTHTVTK